MGADKGFPICVGFWSVFSEAVAIYIAMRAVLPGTWIIWGVVHITLLAIGLVAYYKTCFCDPGFVPKGWLPPSGMEKVEGESQPIDTFYRATYCSRCESYRPPRAHHSSYLRRCVCVYDHTCPWVANAIGLYNQKYFLQFLFYATITQLSGALSCGAAVLSKIDDQDSASMAFCGITLWVYFILCFAAVSMFFTHLSLALSNATSVEKGALGRAQRTLHNPSSAQRDHVASLLAEEHHDYTVNSKTYMQNLTLFFGSRFGLKWFLPFDTTPVKPPIYDHRIGSTVAQGFKDAIESGLDHSISTITSHQIV